MRRSLLFLAILLLALIGCSSIPDGYFCRPTGEGYRLELVSAEMHTADEITIPDTWRGHPITSIAIDAFADCTALKTLHIGPHLRELAPTAFLGCASLREITVDPDNPYLTVEHNCLIERKTGRLILGGMDGDIPAAVRSIAPFAFAGRASLETVTLPKGLSSLGQGAFNDCTALTSITIGAQVTANLHSAMIGCPALAEITVDPDNPTYRAEQNCLILCEGDALLLRGKGADLPDGIVRLCGSSVRPAADSEVLVIPDGVRVIDEVAIRGSFAEIYLPASVETIAEGGLLLNASRHVVVHCAAAERPAGWHTRWYIGDAVEVRWGENFNKFPSSP